MDSESLAEFDALSDNSSALRSAEDIRKLQAAIKQSRLDELARKHELDQELARKQHELASEQAAERSRLQRQLLQEELQEAKSLSRQGSMKSGVSGRSKASSRAKPTKRPEREDAQNIMSDAVQEESHEPSSKRRSSSGTPVGERLGSSSDISPSWVRVEDPLAQEEAVVASASDAVPALAPVHVWVDRPGQTSMG